MDFPESAGVYGATHVYEGGVFVEVGSHEPVFPVFRGLAMGWSWALWAMHTTVSTIVASVLPGGTGALVLDRASSPVLQKG
jgi:hypothetical protein